MAQTKHTEDVFGGGSILPGANRDAKETKGNSGKLEAEMRGILI